MYKMPNIRLFFEKLLGGRPMHFRRQCFIDAVSHKPVNEYIDCYERIWMANNKWGWFRVRKSIYPVVFKNGNTILDPDEEIEDIDDGDFEE